MQRASCRVECGRADRLENQSLVLDLVLARCIVIAPRFFFRAGCNQQPGAGDQPTQLASEGIGDNRGELGVKRQTTGWVLSRHSRRNLDYWGT